MNDELTKAIDKLIEDKVFSMEVVGRIAKLRETAEAQAKELEAKEKECREKSELYDKECSRNLDLAKELYSWRGRHENLVERENKMTEWEVRVKLISDHKAELYNLLYGLMRNTNFRRKMTGMAPGHGNDYSTVVSVNEESETTEE